MFFVNVLVGAVGLSGLAAAILLAMRGAEQAVARLLGLPRFRWFEIGRPEPRWKRLLVRAVSSLVPYAICGAMFSVVAWAGGFSEPTTAVEVLDGGAAREAGMQDGDKLLVVGGVPVHTWDEARAQIQTHSSKVLITIERSGQRQELSVTPRDNRIGVAPVNVMRPVGLAEAAALGLRLPLTVVADSAKGFVNWQRASDLKGPVGIVRETGRAARSGWLQLLYFLAVIGSYSWPFVVAVHVFDVATGWVFRMTSTEPNLPELALRMARLRFSIYFALGCWLAFLVAQLAVGADVPGAALLVALAMPGVWALWPLLWVSGRELETDRALLAVLAPVTLVPCVTPILGVWLALRLRQAELRLRSRAMLEAPPT